MSIKWNGKELKTLKEDFRISSASVDKNGKNIYMLKSGIPSKFKIDGSKVESLPFSAKMTIDHEVERKQVFDEGWRSLRDGFYDPEFHGQDWQQLRLKYEGRALAASTAQDFRDMFNYMLGQVNASHMGMYGSNPEDLQSERTGMLGIEGEPVANGFKITRILTNTAADRSDSKLKVEDIITHVNGMDVADTDNFYELLIGTTDERILLVVVDTSGQNRDVVVRPSRSIRTELYENWVNERKRLTDEYSGGRLGYIHIQGMNMPSFERFERELTASGYGKEGLVIDVRFNGGGWTTDYLMAVLNVRQHAYTIPRGAVSKLDSQHLDFKEHYPYGERLPLSSWTKPSIALCNQSSYSNAEIFSHAFKTLDRGTLVGMPTFGAVISTGSQSLVDGSRVRMPGRGWYVKATEENMEHGPAVPDIIVENPPESKAKGEDLQLKTAVEHLLQQLDQQ
jgi:C-terminal processing protease CtpA/Prc